ncbi:MAG: aldo/keto reductase [Treponema sp.]|nr:aldo/keto reductase [Treponema sp.]
MSTEMQYRIDPKSGNRLSALGFGCMRFPVSAALREELITTAVKSGINYFDTAWLYPGSESALGGILKKNGLRGKVFIADKLPHAKCKTSDDMEKLFLESLGRLQTDYIDYYLIHNIGSPDIWERLGGMGIKEWIAGKKAKGQIREIGFSFHGKSVNFKPLLEAWDWDFCQIQYNYMNENDQAGTAGLAAIHEKGIAAIIMEPLLGGRLAQKLPKAAMDLFDKTVPGRTPAAWGFKWLWDKPEVTVVLSGMNAMAQLTENITIAGDTPAGSLTERERAVYGEVCKAVSGAYKVPCTSCSYCMPCPHGVNIPGCFHGYNMSYVLGFLTGLISYINSVLALGSKSAGPDKCTGCGVCLAKCPQNINIPVRLKELRKRMEPLPIRALLAVVKKVMG